MIIGYKRIQSLDYENWTSPSYSSSWIGSPPSMQAYCLNGNMSMPSHSAPHEDCQCGI